MLDKLPAKLRSLVKAAPYDYAMRPLWADYVGHRDGYTEEQIARLWARGMARDRGLEAARLYGSTHPQAAS